MKKYVLLFIITITCVYAQEFRYTDRSHSRGEVWKDQAIVFSGHLTGYLLTQSDIIRKEGSSDKYKNNFLQFHFDNDNTNWNLIGHTYTGSQVYLYYRSQGYSKSRSFFLSFTSSLWFEILIENYTEKPSIQDTFNTPIFGSAMGYAIELGSTKLLNSENVFYRFVGRVLNPFSFLVDQKKLAFMPYFKSGDDYLFQVSYKYD